MEGTIAAPNSLACFMHNFSFYISHQLGIESLATNMAVMVMAIYNL
jgi:hypothetical protein